MFFSAEKLFFSLGNFSIDHCGRIYVTLLLEIDCQVFYGVNSMFSVFSKERSKLFSKLFSLRGGVA